MTIGALDTLIASTKEFYQTLCDHRTIIANAISMCSQAMRSDQISAEYIKKLKSAQEKIDLSIEMTENMIAELIKERDGALDILLS